jgi:tetratricopeptide (TPR) repeat protein
VDGGAVGQAANIPETIKAASEANPMLQLFLMACLKVFLLLVHIIIPLHISVIYEGPEIQQALGVFIYLIPLLLGGLVYLAWRWRVKHNYLFFGLMFFLLTISPAIAIGKYGGVGVFIGDRYTYAPMLGILIILIVCLIQQAATSHKWFILLSSLLLLVYMALTIPAIRVWRNSETLWTNAIEKTKCASPAYNGRGVYYQDVLKDPDKAFADFTNAVRCDSTHARALYNHALLLMIKKQEAEALREYSSAIRYNPKYVEAYVNRGNILRDNGQNEEAMADYNTALQLSPQFSKGYFNRGTLYLNLKRNDEAIADFTKAITIDPSYAKAFYNRGLAYYNMNNQEKACEEFKTSLNLGYQNAAKTIKDHCQ